MAKILTAYFAVLVIFVSIDLVWLAIVARGIYLREIGGLLAARPGLIAATLFYLLYAAGLTLFAVKPAVAAGSLAQALFFGAAAGLFAYATYDLTNLSVTKGFTNLIAIVDMTWGTLLSAATSAMAYLLVTRIWPTIN